MIVTGCQRSGTKTMAAILGIAHEQQFLPYANGQVLDINNLPKPHQLRNESSWLAVPFLSHYPQIPIIHIIRNPLAVINSIMGIEFFNDNPEKEHIPFLEFIEHHLPTIKNINKSDADNIALARTVYYYIQWNRKIEKLNRSIPRIRIESIINAPKLNHRIPATLAWQDIKNSISTHLYDQLIRLTKLYGYCHA